MRSSTTTRRILLALALLFVSGCAGIGGEGSALAKAGRKSQAFALLERPNLSPKDLFAPRAPLRHVQCLAVVGDSLSISLASELEKSLAEKPGLAFVRLGKVSSGLARPDFFDWDRHMEDVARRYRPDAVAIMIGANDNKHLRQPDGSQITYGTPQWDKDYAARVRRLVEIARRHNPQAVIFWMGAPVMADGALSGDLRHINALVRKTLTSLPDCHYVDTWQLFSAPDGSFVFSKDDVEGGATLRARDGVHMTQAGAQALAGRALLALQSRLVLGPPVPAAVPVAASTL
ncbi:hypothetical protein NNJEOMEG_00909 [Fundidesulfovibrio magnetotacticus]|uniref:SGNH hydrolase-type esterase domain-containing protein n=1 Tax=Fundidesulfovibrio magnetotacticus TaxID=2730080 RepID=A0A6V8LQ32_9BACT|nr:DUF459 domain-containing protein [Fundidesulfovibrio magnetotacticus]GFK93080.1 hypothetical protein NNJEOMEG_00909 [Fundidesulfovibrio magnetotacticus]